MFATDFDKQMPCCPVKTSDYITLTLQPSVGIHYDFSPGQHERECSAALSLFELPSALVRFNHIARFIVNANHNIM